MTPQFASITYTPPNGCSREVGALLQTDEGVRLLPSRTMTRGLDAECRDEVIVALAGVLARLGDELVLPDVGERFRLGDARDYPPAGRGPAEIPMRFREVRS